ncbi:hypothetical protein M378DRAFT_165140 [Amanita muscaria Koide BX008]|uniref:Uncharacterized protein n=1 Tax=Amanita muscaria (strain Koide BX008) TaxID=946122 RepID=A0A0C2SI66_AMAMK|nr:hypothetical protein M378DRAFT_165140 [Amanita muscaria Koide BX008]
MSGKQTGYRVEYANSSRAKCKGPKPCSGTSIQKEELRFGTLVDFRGATSFAWRHWGCVTPKILQKMKEMFSDPSDLNGYDDLKAEDQERIQKALEEGHVADEDIPNSARKKEGEEDKPKKRATKRKAASDDEGEEEVAEKPKKSHSTQAKVTCSPSPPRLLESSLPTLTTAVEPLSDHSETSHSPFARFHCRLCQADMCNDPTATMCGHLFCYRCITESVIRTPRCPTCATPTLLYCLFRLDLSA